MSTRANIEIKDSHESALFYRHSDGNPEETLPTLKLFMQYVADGEIRNNVAQAAGWLILIGAEERQKAYSYCKKTDKIETKIKTKKQSLRPLLDWRCGAYEPAQDMSSDIEYLYILDLTKLTISVLEVEDMEHLGLPNRHISLGTITITKNERGTGKK
jgi:hypothetical protein